MNNRNRWNVRHRCIVAIVGQNYHDRNNQVNNALHQCLVQSNQRPSNLFHTYIGLTYNDHDRNISDQDSQLFVKGKDDSGEVVGVKKQ